MHTYRTEDGQASTEKGIKVRFHLSDVFLPNTSDLRADFHEGDEIEGTLIDFSDSGERQHAFALIEITQKRTVIILVEKLYPAKQIDGAENGN